MLPQFDMFYVIIIIVAYEMITLLKHSKTFFLSSIKDDDWLQTGCNATNQAWTVGTSATQQVTKLVSKHDI